MLSLQCCTLLRTLGHGRCQLAQIGKLNRTSFGAFPSHLGILDRGTKFRTFWDRWTEFFGLRMQGKVSCRERILRCSGMGRYWNFPGAAWNLETIYVWYTFLSHENLGSVRQKLFTSFKPCSVQFCTELHFRSLQP